MTREEEINNASYAYWVNNYANIEFIDEEEKELHTQDIQESFINGAEWADQHPHWISVEDGLPKDGQYVATINTVGVKDVRHYSRGKWYSNFGNEYDDITHWMPLPQAPKKGGEE